jgi:hypothetical protein
MALTPELGKLKSKLEALSFRRTSAQDRLLIELQAIDDSIMQKSIEEGYAFNKVQRMTSPGDGACACCGR